MPGMYAFSQENGGTRTEIRRASKDYECASCHGTIKAGEKHFVATTPPWFGEWDGDVDENGHVIGIPVNTHKWAVVRTHRDWKVCSSVSATRVASW